MAGEVGHAVTPPEYQEIFRDRILRTRRIKGMRRRASLALVNAQHELAFRKLAKRKAISLRIGFPGIGDPL